MTEFLEMLQTGGPWGIVVIMGSVVAFQYKENRALQAEMRREAKESSKQALDDARQDQRELTELVITVRNTMYALKLMVETVLARLPKE